MNPLNLIPTPYRILVLVIALALTCSALLAVGWSKGADHVQAKWDVAKAAQMELAVNAEQAARAKEQDLMSKLEKAQNDATEREKKLRADYDAAHAAALGLRDTVAAIRRGLPGDTAEACRVTADTALAVFGECSARYTAVAEDADGHASDVQTLSEAWPK